MEVMIKYLYFFLIRTINQGNKKKLRLLSHKQRFYYVTIYTIKKQLFRIFAN